MKKMLILTRFWGLLTLLWMAVPSWAQPVLTPNEESGIENATHTWTDDDGNVLSV